MAKILLRLGHSVDTAGTATEGLDRLSKQAYELVLTDFRLPDLDGLEVIERARALRPETELVLFTGFGSTPLDVQAIKRGAFTGAHTRKDGRFARADGGTLFLDEIGTLSLPIQAKLLRTLQDGTFEPLGSTRTVESDCRIIAATNTDLSRAVKEGLFREDLYYRLNVIRIAMPSLKERPDDVPLLPGHFLALHAARNGRSLDGFEPDALGALRAYDWPGNVRELSHAVERAVVLATGRTITRDCLPEAVRQAARPEPEPLPGDEVIAVPVRTARADVEKLVISETLRRTGGNKAQAASLLGISARTIYRKQAPSEGEIE